MPAVLFFFEDWTTGGSTVHLLFQQVVAIDDVVTSGATLCSPGHLFRGNREKHVLEELGDVRRIPPQMLEAISTNLTVLHRDQKLGNQTDRSIK